jgi:RNA polymerase subunit RPABC4/transcription elongation factor Spt4
MPLLKVTFKCGKCSARIHRDTLVCPKCGADVAGHCTRCGAGIAGYDQVCPGCGITFSNRRDSTVLPPRPEAFQASRGVISAEVQVLLDRHNSSDAKKLYMQQTGASRAKAERLVARHDRYRLSRIKGRELPFQHFVHGDRAAARHDQRSTVPDPSAEMRVDTRRERMPRTRSQTVFWRLGIAGGVGLLLFVIVIAIALVSGAGNTAGSDKQKPIAVPAAPRPTTIASTRPKVLLIAHGMGDAFTASFIVPGVRWGVAWAFNCGGTPHDFSVGDGPGPIGPIADVYGKRHGTGFGAVGNAASGQSDKVRIQLGAECAWRIQVMRNSRVALTLPAPPTRRQIAAIQAAQARVNEKRYGQGEAQVVSDLTSAVVDVSNGGAAGQNGDSASVDSDLIDAIGLLNTAQAEEAANVPVPARFQRIHTLMSDVFRWFEWLSQCLPSNISIPDSELTSPILETAVSYTSP